MMSYDFNVLRLRELEGCGLKGLASLLEVRGSSSYFDVMSWTFEKLGLKKFSYVYLDYLPSESNSAFIVGNYCQKWVDYYREMDLHKSDPVIFRSSHTSFPFLWDSGSKLSDSGGDIFKLSSEYGIEKGFSVPIHEPGSSFGSIHFATTSDDNEFECLIYNKMHCIISMCYLLHQYRPKEVGAMKLDKLSSREVECLKLISIGKTYEEIGIVLGITERTVKFHVKNCMVKLNCINAKQTMAKALRLNLF